MDQARSKPMSENRHTKKSDAVDLQNDGLSVQAHEHTAFEEETRRANERMQDAIQTIRIQDLPQATEPAFQFRSLF
jgi:hypothetical protein